MKKYTENDVVELIALAALITSQKQLAKKFGISPQYLNDILNYNRPLTDKVIEAFGFRKISYLVEDK